MKLKKNASIRTSKKMLVKNNVTTLIARRKTSSPRASPLHATKNDVDNHERHGAADKPSAIVRKL
jgi:hypothetical protein